MKKRRLLLLILGGVLLLLSATMAGSYYWLSANNFQNLRETASTELRDRLGLELTIKGEVSISLSLIPTVVVSDVSLSNPNWNGEQTLFTASQVEVRFKLLPLIGAGEIDSQKVRLVDGKIHIDRHPDGRSNWSLGTPDKSSDSTDSLSALPDIVNIDLKNVGVYLTGPDKNEKHLFLVTGLSASAPDHDKATTISGSGKVDNLEFSIEGAIDSWKSYRQGSESDLKGSVKVGAATALLSGTLGKPGVRFEKGIGFDIKGQNLAFLNAWLPIVLPETTEVSAKGTFKGKDGRYLIEVASLSAKHTPFVVTGNGDITIDDGQVTLATTVSVEGQDLQKAGLWLAGLDLLPAKLPATGSFSASGMLKGGTDNLAINGIDATIQTDAGTSTLKGNIGDVDELTGLDFDVAVSGGNLGDYLAPMTPLIDIDFTLPETDSYSLSGHLAGSQEKLKASGIKAEAKQGALDASLSGSIEDVIDLSGLDLTISARGRNLQALAAEFDLKTPPIGRFESTGKLVGTIDNIGVAALNGSAQLADATVKLDGTIRRVQPLQGLNLNLDVSGGDLSALSESLGVKLPTTAVYQAKGLLQGDESALALSGLSGSMGIEGESLSFTGEVGNVEKLSGLALDVQGSGENLARPARLIDLHLPPGIKHKFAGSLAGSIDALALSGATASAQYKDASVTLNGGIQDLMSVKGIAADFDVLGPADQIAAMAGSDWDDAGAVKATGRFSGMPSDFELSDFVITAGESMTSGSLKFFLGEGQPSVSGSLGKTVIKLGASDPVPDEEQDDTNIQFDWMDALDIDLSYGELSIKRNAAAFDLDPGKILMKDGKLDLDPVAFEYKKQIISGGIHIDGPNDKLAMTFQSTGLNYGQLIADLGISDRLVASGDFYFDITGTGADEVELKHSLAGKARFLIGEGTVSDFGTTNLSYVAQLMPWRNKDAPLHFACILSSMTINTGIVDMDTMFINSDDMVITGGGTIAVANDTIDLAFAPRAKKKGLLDSNISLFVKGPLDDPHLSIGKLSAITDVGIKYGSWAVLGPFAIALPFLPGKKIPDCAKVTDGIMEEQNAVPAAGQN